MVHRRIAATFGAIAIILTIVACGVDDPTPNTAPASRIPTSAAVTGAVSSPGTITTIDANAPTNATLGPPSADAQRVATGAAATLGLKPVESYCLARRIDADPALVAALGGVDPQRSARWQDLTNIAVECIRVTTEATNWANGIQTQANGALSTQTLTCLRDSYGHLSAEDTRSFVRAGLNPGTIDTNAQQKITGLLAGCGVDPAKLRQSRH